jgi:type I restriction enzyme S subunit
MIEGPYAVYGGNGISGYHNAYFLEEPIIVIGRVGEYCGAVHVTKPKSWVTDNGLYVTNYLMKVNQAYLALALTQLNLNQFAKVGGQPSISQTTVCEQSIPLPPLEVQQAIVAEIEKERALVEASRQLAAAMQNKIKAVVEKVWQA